MDVDRGDARRAMRRQQPVHQRLEAVGLLDDHLRVFLEIGLVELALEQLRRAAQPAERVLDFVRQITDQLAVGLLLGHHPLLPRQAQLLLDRAQLDQQRDAGGVDSGHDARQRQLFASRAQVSDHLGRVVPVRFQGLCEGALDSPSSRRTARERPARSSTGRRCREGSRPPGWRSAPRSHRPTPPPRWRAGPGPQIRCSPRRPAGTHRSRFLSSRFSASTFF